MPTREDIKRVAPGYVKAVFYLPNGVVVKEMKLWPEWTPAGIFRFAEWDAPVLNILGFEGRLNATLTFTKTKGIKSEEAS